MGPDYISHLPAASSYFLREFYSLECGGAGSFAARWVLCWFDSLSARGAIFIIRGLWPQHQLPPAFVSTEVRCWCGREWPPAEIILICVLLAQLHFASHGDNSCLPLVPPLDPSHAGCKHSQRMCVCAVSVFAPSISISELWESEFFFSVTLPLSWHI